MEKNDHAKKTDQIIDAMRHLIVRPKGRSIRRYTHGWANRERTEYYVGYTWSRLHADHMTGNVYDVTLGKGSDFESALANAIKKETAKRARHEAERLKAQP